MNKTAFCIPSVRNRLLGFRVLVTPKTSILSSFFSGVSRFLSIGLIALAILVGVSYFAPQIYYNIFPSNQLLVEAETQESVKGGNKELAVNIPLQDENLPEGDWLIIPRIAVRTNLIKTENQQEALNKGVWQVPEFGNPGSTDKPVILAAHRFGLKWMWESLVDGETYALRNIFYKLPETEPGDIIEIISDQRRYVYEIYSGEENDEITDYSANLILYTCKYINSPVRLIRYAKLIDY